jgi:sialate O-acetylesterase
MKLPLLRICISILFCIGALSQLKAALKFPKLISNGMVLQRDSKVKIWGYADKGEVINISAASLNLNLSTKADQNGQWAVILPKLNPGGPHTIIFKTNTEQKEISDVYIGDVYVCSGQSNMEQSMSGRLKYKYAEEIKNVNNPLIRHFLVPRAHDLQNSQADFSGGGWTPANAQTINQFTAVGYFFAKELYQKYKIPIGLINASIGGSPAEAWISAKGLKSLPTYDKERAKWADQKLREDTEALDKNKIAIWEEQVRKKDIGLREHWHDKTIPPTGWASFDMPGLWKDVNGLNVIGAVWCKVNLRIPPAMIGKAAKLELGRIVDTDSVFLNNTFIGASNSLWEPRRYEIAPGVIKSGTNTLTIRVVSKYGRGGFVPDRKYELTTDTDTLRLNGLWFYKIGSSLTEPSPATTNIRMKPSGFYNAMIAPLASYNIKGALWYQGETNANYPDDYSQVMSTLIKDWRQMWGYKNLPFLMVQLPNYLSPSATPQLNSKWATLRDKQTLTMNTNKNVGMSTNLDIGEWNDIHPENKVDIAKRLAQCAYHIIYKEKNIPTGPIFKSAKRSNGSVIINFDHSSEKLTTSDGKVVKHLFIAGKDEIYYEANVFLEGTKLRVSHFKVPDPIHIRYAWADNPIGANLVNALGLPASPFYIQVK